MLLASLVDRDHLEHPIGHEGRPRQETRIDSVKIAWSQPIGKRQARRPQRSKTSRIEVAAPTVFSSQK